MDYNEDDETLLCMDITTALLCDTNSVIEDVPGAGMSKAVIRVICIT